MEQKRKGDSKNDTNQIEPSRLRSRISLSTRVFLIISVSLMVPVYLLFIYMNHNFSQYLDKEISSKVVQTIENSEQEIIDLQQNMVSISNMLVSNSELEAVMLSPTTSYYERCNYFDGIVEQLENSNIFDRNQLKITLFDSEGRIYTNWSVNYHDYSFLLEKDWVKKTEQDAGYLNWDMFGESPFTEEYGKNIRYISLARTMFSQEYEDVTVGTLIISMNVAFLNKLLDKYKFSDNDMIFVYESSGQTVLNTALTEDKKEDFLNVLKCVDKKSGYFTEEIASNKYMINYYTLSDSMKYQNESIKLVAFIDYQNVAEKTQAFMLKTTIYVLAASVLLLLVVVLITRMMVSPIKDIAMKVNEYEVGNRFEYQYGYKDEIGDLYESFDGMIKNIEDLFERLNHEYAIKEKYRFESLRAQINPHFIFNTLNSIRWMAIIRKQTNIVESIDAMTEMLQYSMNKGSDFVTLKQELDSIEAYIYIQNMRYGNLYELKIDIPERLYTCQMIKFSLQPIVENCIIHGFQGMEEKGVIIIEGNIEGESLCIKVKNNGALISDLAIDEFKNNKQRQHRDSKQVTGIGMANVDEIIRITYGEVYGLQVRREEDMTVIEYRLPNVSFTNLADLEEST